MPQSWEGRGEVGRAGGCVGIQGTLLPLIPRTLRYHLGCPFVWEEGCWLGSLAPCAYLGGIHTFHLLGMYW